MIKVIYNGEINKTAFKDIFTAKIPELCQKDPMVIYLDADLMSCIGTAKFGKAHPERAINCGISEANMIGVAAGLASAGFKPIAHSFGPFASRRCYDQAFLSAGYAGNAITIIGSDPGVCAAFNGGTHMPFEDTALYRALPGSTVLDISDTAQLSDVLERCQSIPGVKYLRVHRKNNGLLYEEGSEFPIGKAVEVRAGQDLVIFASGIMVFEAMKAADRLAEEGIEAAVLDMFSIKPLDEEAVLRYTQNCGAVVIAENHNRIGGLVSAVKETLAGKTLAPIEYVAVEDAFGEVGPLNYLQERFGLTADQIYAKAKLALERK